MPSSAAPSEPGPAEVIPAESGRKIALTLFLLVAVAILVPSSFAVYASIWRYRQVHALHVLWVKWGMESLLFAVGGVLTFVLIRGALALAYRTRLVFLPMTEEEILLEKYRAGFEPYRRRIEWVIPAIVAVFAGATAAGQWRKAVLWWHSTTFGVVDPTFHHDAGFYVFTLPWFRFLTAFATMLLVLSLLASVAAHVVYGGISMRGISIEGGRRTTHAARVQLSILLAALFFVRALAATLARYGLATASGDRFGGVTYLAEHILDPADALLAVLAACVGGLFVSVLRTDSIRLPLTGAAVYLLISVVGLDIAAPLYGHLSVTPHAERLEGVHARQAMTAQLDAFDLGNLRKETMSVAAVPEASRRDAAAALAAPVSADTETPADPSASPSSTQRESQDALARVSRVVPGLRVDGHPYEISDGATRLWLVDVYSASDDFPGSQTYDFGAGSADATGAVARRSAGVNYVRNSVKATVDQRSGVVRLYAADPKEPILRAWDGVFGTKLTPLSQAPAAVRAGGRYPADLFEVQRDVLERYHPRSTADFLTGSSWQGAIDPEGQPEGVPAVSVRGPVSVADGRSQLGRSAQLVSGQGSNAHLAALLTAPDGNGPLTLSTVADADTKRLPDPGQWSKGLRASAQREVDGRQTLSDVVKKAQQRERVSFGPVLVVRIKGGLLYAEQVTSTPDGGNAKPRQIAMILRSGGATVWAPSSDAALRGLAAATGQGAGPSTTALADAQRALDDMNAAQARGDDAAYTKAAGQLQRALDRAGRASK